MTALDGFTSSYFDLCRERPLDHKAEVGDWFITQWISPTMGYIDQTNTPRFYGIEDAPDGQEIWIPRLDQLLDLLEAAGRPVVEFRPLTVINAWQAGTSEMRSDGRWEDAEGLSREEAAYRLLLGIRSRKLEKGAE